MYKNLLINLSKKIENYFSEIEEGYNFDLGLEFEIALCKIIHDLLPTKFGVCRGYIVDRYGNEAGDDIIIYDRLRFPTLRILGSENFAQKQKVPFEAVYGYIEAKHNLKLDENLDEKVDGSLDKALKQIRSIKSLKRPDRCLNQITEIYSLINHKITAPLGWNEILNPLYTCIISRKTSLDKTSHAEGYQKGLLNKDITYNLLKNRVIPQNNGPDLIVAGDGVVVLPGFKNAGNTDTIHIMPFIRDLDFYHRIKTNYNALAVGLCQMLWALERIQLESMPWEEIIVNATIEKMNI